MTRDELLADINKYYSDIESGLRWEPDCYIKALRAVVELHKPMLWKNLGNDTDGYKCQVCEGNSYPCPTIQAIKKELK